MARPTASPGQEMSVDNVNLDDLSLDDDALFADLDNEVRLEGAADDSLALGGTDDLDLNFDVEALPSGSGSTAPAKSGNGKGSLGVDDLNLDMDDVKLSDSDLDLNLDGMSSGGGDLKLDMDDASGGDLNLELDGGTGGDLNLNFDTPAMPGTSKGDGLDFDISDTPGGGDGLNLDLDSSPAAPGTSQGDGLDFDISDATGGDGLNFELAPPERETTGVGGDVLDLELGEPAAPKDVPMGDGLDLTLDMDESASAPAVATREDLDLNFDLDEPAQPAESPSFGTREPAFEASAAAGDTGLETFELDMGDSTMTAQAPVGTRRQMDFEDRSFSKGAEELDELTLADDSGASTQGSVSSDSSEPLLDLGALASADAAEAPTEEFQAMPDLDLDSVDLNLDQTASEFKAVPDIDLDTVDLNLNMPMAETHGDAGAPVAPVVEAPVPKTGPRMFSGMGTGVGAKLEVAQDELLELNLSDLESKPAGGPATAEAPAKSSAAQGQFAAPAIGGSGVGAMLLSIPHQVQVRMGSVSLLGQDILNLAHGSVVPLNRAVGEPVDLTLEGKTIAQGEVVIINGRNLGVRIVSLSK